MNKRDKEAMELARALVPLLAGKRLDVILRAFELLKQTLIETAAGCGAK